MKASQADLFGKDARAAPAIDPSVLAMIRERLHRTLALVRAAESMPWADQMTIIREDNAFRHAKDFLPQAEGAALWAEFDAHMDRLYAIMNEGKEMPPED
jgi:hypothetical protein